MERKLFGETKGRWNPSLFEETRRILARSVHLFKHSLNVSEKSLKGGFHRGDGQSLEVMHQLLVMNSFFSNPC